MSKNYGIFCMAMAMPEHLRDVYELDTWWDMAERLYANFLLSKHDDSNLSELECINAYAKSKMFEDIILLENNDKNKRISELEHRLAMVSDDLRVIEKFFRDNHCEDLLNLPTDKAESCIAHFSNIHAACDLNDDQCLSWRRYQN